MFCKFAAGFFAVMLAVAASAAEIISYQLNFYSADGDLKLQGKPSAGVKLKKKIRFRNPELIGHAFPLEIDLNETDTIEATVVITSGSGKIVPSLSARGTKSGRGGRFSSFVCTEFDYCGEPSAKKLPFTVTKWTNMLPAGVIVSEGDTVTIRAKFERVK